VRVGLDAVDCRVAEVQKVLFATAAADVGGGKQLSRLQARAQLLRNAVVDAHSAQGGKAAKTLSRAKKLLRAFIAAVQRGQHSGKIHEPTAGNLLGQALRARAELAPLRPSRTLSPRV